MFIQYYRKVNKFSKHLQAVAPFLPRDGEAEPLTPPSEAVRAPRPGRRRTAHRAAEASETAGRDTGKGR